MEFATTSSDQASADPVPPEGDGWMLAGVVGEQFPPPPGFAQPPYTVVHFYWQRETQARTRTCAKCKAVAFKDGKCIGCGTEVTS